jgi:hypothetical protein
LQLCTFARLHFCTICSFSRFAAERKRIDIIEMPS